MDFDENGIKRTGINIGKNTDPADTPAPASRGPRGLIAIMAVLLVAALVGIVFLWMKASGSEDKVEALVAERDSAQIAAQQAQLDLQQQLMQEEFDALDRQFSQIENQRIVIRDDSVKRDLQEKYMAAKNRLEELKRQLQDERRKSAAEIKRLNDEVGTLRDLLRQYLAQIDQLTKENQQLREENQDLRDRNSALNTQVEQKSRENERLSERMTLAEKLNVTGLQLTALNSKGKSEKKVEKAKQLIATFTIPQNNSTPVGQKTIYMRIVSPSGQLLGNGGSFSFEGASVPCTASKIIDYAGQEIAGIRIYWDVNTALTPGDYTVELFADNFRLVSRTFNLK